MVDRVHLPRTPDKDCLTLRLSLSLLILDCPVRVGRHVIFPGVYTCEEVWRLIWLRTMCHNSVGLTQVKIILVITLMMQGIVQVLITNSVVYLVHLDVFMKEILVFAALKDLKTSRLSPLDVISHESSLNSSLQNELA